MLFNGVNTREIRMEILLVIAFLIVFYLATRFIFSLKGMLQLRVQACCIAILLVWFWTGMDGNFTFKIFFTTMSLVGLGREYFKFKAEKLS